MIALSSLSEILQGGCMSHPVLDQCCSEDETPVVYTCKISQYVSFNYSLKRGSINPNEVCFTVSL